MDRTSEGVPVVREDVLSLKFPTKLWLLVNTPNKVVGWCSKGESFTVNFMALDDYLCSKKSFFRVKTKSKFIRYLTAYGFQSVTPGNCNHPENGLNFEFKHEYFLRGRSDLIGKIVKRSGAVVVQRHGLKLSGVQQRSFKPPNRKFDPCHGLISKLTKIERARLNLRVILRFQTEHFVLNKKLAETSESSATNLAVIEVPADVFENPLDSISSFTENPEIAGFYGKASTGLIKRFFDAYLPLYASSNGDDGNEKSTEDTTSQAEGVFETTDSTPTTAYVESDSNNYTSQYNASYPSNFQIEYSVNIDSSESKEYTINVLDETSGEMTTVEKSYYEENANASGLEPIYTDCDKDDECSSKDEDISMDDYLKFNKKPKTDGDEENASEDKEVDEAKTDTGPPNTDELNEDNENFRHFFNQYRESINLLYE